MNIVFIFNEFALHNHIIDSYCDSRPQDLVAIVKVPLVLRGKSRAETASRLLPRLSKRFIWNKFKEFLVVAIITILPKMLGRGAIFRRLRSIARRRGLAFHLSPDVMSATTLDFIKKHNPDLIITLVHQIIRSALIEIPRLGVINIHPGILPNFRGIQPYFWELLEGFGKGGATLHLIEDETIDSGGLVAMATFPTQPAMSVQLNYYLTARSAAHLLPQVVSFFETGSIRPVLQDTTLGNYYRWPESAAVDTLIQRGHQIVSWWDLLGILNGQFDSFAPKDIAIFSK